MDACIQKASAEMNEQTKKVTDDELMHEARSGSSQAFEALVRRYQTTLLMIASKMMGSADQGHDVVQNTFLEVYRYLPRYEPMGKFSHFIRRILLNQCRLAWRQSRSRQRVNTAIIQIKNTSPLLEDKNSLEAKSEVQYALNFLCHKHRSAIVLRYGLGYSYQEIADTLGIPIGTVKSRICCGLKEMKNTLQTKEPIYLQCAAA